MVSPVLYLRQWGGPGVPGPIEPLSAEEIDTIFRALELTANFDPYDKYPASPRPEQIGRADALIAKLRSAENG